MGYYIDPTDCTKEQWLLKHGTPVAGPPDWQAVHAAGALPVCLVDNRMFTAAGVAFSPNEQAAFARPDGRDKRWFTVPVSDLHAVGAIPKGFAIGELGP